MDPLWSPVVATGGNQSHGYHDVRLRCRRASISNRRGPPAHAEWVKKRLRIHVQIMQRGSPMAGRVGLCS